MLDLDGDGVNEVLPLEGDVVHGFRLKDQTTWERVGSWGLPVDCPRLKDEMMAGRFMTSPAERPRWPDLEISGMRFPLVENTTGTRLSELASAPLAIVATRC